MGPHYRPNSDSCVQTEHQGLCCESGPSLTAEEITQWVAKHVPNRAVSLPHLFLCTDRLSEKQYGQVLASADAFVLPTRGEGFGLPMVSHTTSITPGATCHLQSLMLVLRSSWYVTQAQHQYMCVLLQVEAMSMGIPVLSTQYSGVAAYLDSTVGYPVPYKEVDVPAEVKQPWFKGGSTWHTTMTLCTPP
jgi:glycosyltransferase involved in cell wall biosynthesis